MARSPLQVALDDWTARAQYFRSRGIPDGQWNKLAGQDIQSVLRGGSQMGTNEVNAAIASSVMGKPVIQDPKPKAGGGILGSIEHIAGNVAGDIGNIVTGFIPGVIKSTVHAPSELERIGQFVEHTLGGHGSAEDAWLTAYGYEPVHGKGIGSDLASALRNWAKMFQQEPAPLAFVAYPAGLQTAAEATTAAGRKALQQHPVGALLDTLPLVSGVLEGASAVKEGVTGTKPGPGTVAEALSEGRTSTAAFRALTSLPGASRVRLNVAAWARDIGLHPDLTENLARPYSVIQKRATAEVNALWKGTLEPIFHDLSPEERAQIAKDAKTGQPSSELSAMVLQKVREINLMYEQQSHNTPDSLVRVTTPSGTSEIYPASSDVAQASKSMSFWSDRMQAAKLRLDNVQQDRNAAMQRFMDNTGKVRRFGESAESFAARPEGQVGIGVVHEAVQPLVEQFRYLDPKTRFPEIVQGVTSGVMRTAAIQRLAKDFEVLGGETGLIAKLDDALANGDLRSARSAAVQVARVFKHRAWDGFNTTTTLRSYMAEIRDELQGLGVRERSHNYASRRIAAEEKKVQSATLSFNNVSKTYKNKLQDFHKALQDNPAARWHPLLQDRVRAGAIDQARALYHGSQLEDVIRTVQNAPHWKAIEQAMGKETFDAVWKDAVHNWFDLADQGYDPVWMHYVDPSRYNAILHPTVLPDRVFTPAQLKDKVFNARPGYDDIAAGVTRAGVEYISAEATKRFVNNVLMKFAVKHEDLTNELMTSMTGKKLDPRQNVPAMVAAEISKHYVRFEPEKYGLGGYIRGGPQELLIPKGVDQSLRLMSRDYKLNINGAYDRTLKIWKFSVLTGPRHLVHVAIGGLTMTMIREPRAVFQIGHAIKAVKERSFPIELAGSMYGAETDQIWHFAAGKSMGRMLAEHVGDAAKAMQRFEDTVAQVERVMTFLSAENRGLSRESAIQAAQKVFIDMDGMSPLERTVIRNVFPFYAFTKHIMRYILTLPIDHPQRAAVLAHFGEQEQADWASGLPQKFQQMFFLGKPDAAGNVMGVDYRNINPFRSVANDFTLAGFTQSLNPVANVIGTALGVNMLTATPELYPALTYDAFTGSLTAKRPGLSPLTIAQAVVPETGALDHFFQFTDSMRRLKTSNPQSYRAQLFTALNLPFAWGKVNLPYTREKAEIARYKQAQAAESAGEKTGSFAEALRFNLVPSSTMSPYGTTLVTPQQAEQVYTRLFALLQKAGESGVAPKALTPRRPIRKTSPV